MGRKRNRLSLEPADALVGAWHLVRWGIHYPDGRVTYPFGKAAKGLLLYTHDGFMSASLAAPRRLRLSKQNPRLARTAERAAAFDSFFAYAGTYRVRMQAVTHWVSIALNPAMVGTIQVRRIRVIRGRLELSAIEALPGVTGSRIHRLLWRRVAVP